MKRLLAAAALLFLIGCRKAEPPVFKHVEMSLPTPDYKLASDNLLDIMHGATVVYRTGELSLQSSAQQAFDGDYQTAWGSPPLDPVQSAVVALRARSRVSKVGLVATDTPEIPKLVKSVRIETSLDGVGFLPLTSIEVTSRRDRDPRAAPPTEAAYIRVTMVRNLGGDNVVEIPQIQLYGEELSVSGRPELSGEWKLNGDRLFLSQKGNLLEGYLLHGAPFFIDGGYDGRSFRFAWSRRNQYGLGIMTVDPSGTHISSCEWHLHNVHYSFQMESWFGEKVSENKIHGERPDSVAAYIVLTGAFPLYGLRFDGGGTLDAAGSSAQLERVVGLLKRGGRVRFSAHEMRESSEAANHARAQKELDGLRAALESLHVPMTSLEFAVADKENTIVPIRQPIQRYMYSRIDLERVGR
ncbi:MAG TPA: discoidin domain-containing protein [Thermoanaerobaculia bacterium]|nr:discoidin domain-containing protein [Thermoanaerobaculia bacterium]